MNKIPQVKKIAEILLSIFLQKFHTVFGEKKWKMCKNVVEILQKNGQ